MTEPEQLDQTQEAQLVAQAKANPEAFGLIYERYVKRIYNYIFYRTGNHQDAEDLTARVFYRALAKLESYEDRGVPFSAWLYRIAHNLVANWHRDRSRRHIVALDEFVTAGAPSDAPEALTESYEEQDRLMAAIHKLPPDRQQVLILKFVERLSNAEIGQIMDRTEGAIKSLYHRTLIALRGEFGLPKQAARKRRRWLRRGPKE